MIYSCRILYSVAMQRAPQYPATSVAYGFLGCFFVWLTWVVATHGGPSFLDGVNLIFHEAGHAIFAFAPEYFTVLSGTLMQLAVPMVCVVAFLRQGQPVSAALALWWMGQSMVGVSVYLGDARTQALPLLGGDTVEHDWTYLLDHIGLLPYDTVLAASVRGLAVVVMLAALCAIGYHAWCVAMTYQWSRSAEPYV